jgi:hypothetical protein
VDGDAIGRSEVMNLILTREEGTELQTLLEAADNDLGYEIAATDNATCRAGLLYRRQVLTAILDKLRPKVGADPAPISGAPPALYEELAHPGG